MGALLDRYRASGVAFASLPDGQLRASGVLTDALRVTIRADKPAILAELAANDTATPEQATELRALLAIVAADWPPDEQAEALALALADPDSALTCFRALAADLAPPPPTRSYDDPAMRTCQECANLAPSGRCLAAWRGESFGVGIAVGRRYEPAMPDAPQRCGAYAPGPDDPDQRSGRERWPYLFREAVK